MADRVVRGLYRECKQRSSGLLDLVRRLAEADHQEAEEIKFEKTRDSWRASMWVCASDLQGALSPLFHAPTPLQAAP